jgi:hypothetical protein
MRTVSLLAFGALLAFGCGGSSGSEDVHPPDAGPMDAAAEPPPEPDSGPVACYQCDSALGARGFLGGCHANQAAEAGCAFGDGQAGDTCSVGPPVVGCSAAAPVCVAFNSENVGVCTRPCAFDDQCPNNGLCVLPIGADLFCLWLCEGDTDCPPGEVTLPDAGVPPDAGLPPDGPEPSCYTCDTAFGFNGCHAIQTAGNGCAFGTGQAGDTCQLSSPTCDTTLGMLCIGLAADTVGMCSPQCATFADCPYPANCVDTDGSGFNDHCIFTCTSPGDCPPP